MNVILQGWTELPVATRLLAVRAGGSLVSASKASPALLPALAPLLDSCQAVAGSGPPDLALPALETLLVAVEELPLPRPRLTGLTRLLTRLARPGDRGTATAARRLLARLPAQSDLPEEEEPRLAAPPPPDSLRPVDMREFLLWLGRESGPGNTGWRAAVLESAPSLADPRLQSAWLAWAAAQFCVAAKLRTPLGKAQETLGHIETAVRRLAAMQPEKLDMEQAEACLDFLLALEKVMVNGWDGSVTALPPATKSTQLFFHANRATCQVGRSPAPGWPSSLLSN